MRAICLDTETTGLLWKQEKPDRICELACIEIVNNKLTGRYWHWYINPNRPVEPKAREIHGLTWAFLKDYPLFFEIAEDVLNVIGDDKIIGHNVKFDIDFLNYEFGRLPNYPLIEPERAICTYEIAKQRYPGAKHNLNALCKRLKIDTSKRKLHGALIDTELTARAYLALHPAEQFTLFLPEPPKIEIVKPKFIRPKPLPPRITAAELAAHAEMLKDISNPFWKTFNVYKVWHDPAQKT